MATMNAESSKMGSRKSLRAPKKRKLQSEATAEDRDKEQAVVDAKHRRKQGKLAVIVDLPIDVLYEIFGHLRPVDLLRIARVTKEFRRLLMKKSSRSVWKKTLESVPGLPPPPAGMSEPQWVNLVFDPHCHFCFTTGVRNVEWQFRMRICGKCAKEQMVDMHVHSRNPPSIEDLLPSRPSKRSRRSFLKTEYHNAARELKALDTEEAREMFREEKLKIKAELESHSSLCEKWARTQTYDRSQELSAIRRERFLAISKKLEDLGWGPDLAAMRCTDALEDHELVKRPQRLTERIWAKIEGPIVQFMENMKAKRLAREHAQLILQRKLIAAKVLQTYKNARLPVTELLPEVMDFCEFPPIKVILEQPTEVTVDELSFSDALVLVPDLIKEWKTGITRQLITLMQKQGRDARFRASFPAWLYNEDDDYYEDSLTRDVDDEDIPSDPELLLAKLSLATTTFECTRCGGGDIDAGSDYDDFYEMPFPTTEPLYFPRALGHSCLTRTSEMPWVWIAPPPAEPVARLDHVDGESRKKLSTSLLVLNQCLGKCVASIVTAAGMDPATATVAEMNALDVSFACVHCAVVNGEAGFVTTCFGWHDAAVHHLSRHRSSDHKWVLLDAESRDAARADEALSSPDADSYDGFWGCAHCRDLTSERDPDELHIVQAHLASEHDIIDGEINRDYYRIYEAEPFFPKYTVSIRKTNPGTAFFAFLQVF